MFFQTQPTFRHIPLGSTLPRGRNSSHVHTVVDDVEITRVVKIDPGPGVGDRYSETRKPIPPLRNRLRVSQFLPLICPRSSELKSIIPLPILHEQVLRGDHSDGDG